VKEKDRREAHTLIMRGKGLQKWETPCGRKGEKKRRGTTPLQPTCRTSNLIIFAGQAQTASGQGKGKKKKPANRFPTC